MGTDLPNHNPFSTADVRPGAIEFRFDDGSSAADVVAQLESNGWWGEIVGPHGAGKSTLLRTLIPEIEARGRRVHLFTLAGGQRRLPGAPPGAPGEQVIVDGYEQLSWWSRAALRRGCARRECGLLVAVHRTVGLPLVFEPQPSVELAIELVRELLPPHVDWIGPDDIRRCYERQSGNLRETLFDLYDVYEARGE